ncbi:MAG: response regulator [Rhodospirillaceae bacterium]|nr:response regulator [Rhodospirillaceae bacterium]MBT5513526.1 response regulator [Rhodospirillaceae bacterium]
MAEYDLSNLNVLVVEDNKHMQLMLKEILRSFRIKNVRTSDDGADAIKELKSFAVDLINCDWNMQPIDGLDFVRMVRTDSDSANPFIPFIMLTGHTETQRVFEARDAGISEFLAKPISSKALYQRICSVIERPRQFVKTRRFTGPCRRRAKANDKTNKGRRAEDSEDDSLSQDEIAKLMES